MVWVYFESAENTPNMDIKVFFYLKKNCPQSLWKALSLPDGTIFKYSNIHMLQKFGLLDQNFSFSRKVVTLVFIITFREINRKTIARAIVAIGAIIGRRLP